MVGPKKDHVFHDPPMPGEGDVVIRRDLQIDECLRLKFHFVVPLFMAILSIFTAFCFMRLFSELSLYTRSEQLMILNLFVMLVGGGVLLLRVTDFGALRLLIENPGKKK